MIMNDIIYIVIDVVINNSNIVTSFALDPIWGIWIVEGTLFGRLGRFLGEIWFGRFIGIFWSWVKSFLGGIVVENCGAA